MAIKIGPELLKSHKVTKLGSQSYKIKLNMPEDLVYDVSDIVLCYDENKGVYMIECPEIPDNIKKEMLKFSKIDSIDYVDFLEQNLTVFFMGKVPASPTTESSKNRLSDSFVFPTNNNVSSNIKYDADKKNILYLSADKMSVTVSCLNCQNVQKLGNYVDCNKCRSSIGILYVPVLDKEYLGFISLRKCKLISFDPIKYQIKCLNCQINYESNEIGIGQCFSLNCYHCHKEIKLKINNIEFIEKKSYNLKIGSELPNKGACKHYKKSYRWFRFSCCNSLYPCDDCHNEAVSHKAEEAKRMVCGLCSKEQSVKKECECGMSMKTQHKQFWEGGKGNRNKLTMSRKDNKKYSK